MTRFANHRTRNDKRIEKRASETFFPNRDTVVQEKKDEILKQHILSKNDLSNASKSRAF